VNKQTAQKNNQAKSFGLLLESSLCFE